MAFPKLYHGCVVSCLQPIWQWRNLTFRTKRDPMESTPTDRIRDAGKATHTKERLDLVERMRNKRLSSPIKLLYRKLWWWCFNILLLYTLISLCCTIQENSLVRMGGCRKGKLNLSIFWKRTKLILTLNYSQHKSEF